MEVFKIDTARLGFRVSIDGVEYEAAALDDLGLSGRHRVEWAAARIVELRAQAPGGELSDEAYAELDGILDQVIAVILREVPAEIRARIKKSQRLALIGAYAEAMNG